MRPKSVLTYRRKQPLDRIRDNNPQNQRVGTSGYEKWGSRGLAPGSLSPISREKWGSPAGVGGPPGRCAPRTASELPTQRAVSYTHLDVYKRQPGGTAAQS